MSELERSLESPVNCSENGDASPRQMEALSRLAGQLSSARGTDQVLARVEQTLTAVSRPAEVAVESSSADHRGDRVAVPVPGAGGTVISVPADLPAASMAFVETTVALAGLALRRLAAEDERDRVEDARAALSREVLEEASRERGRLATRMHDEVLPHLAAATIQADNVCTAARAGDGGRVAELACRTREAVNDGIVSTRELLDDLHGEMVVPGRLREALEESIEDLAHNEGLSVRLEAPEVLPALPFSVELLVVETVRGCLANVVRHARANSAEVSLTVHDCHVAVEVADDGCGFDPEDTPSGHGLALMAQRVEMARGRFAVRSTPGQGTTVTMEVPR